MKLVQKKSWMRFILNIIFIQIAIQNFCFANEDTFSAKLIQMRGKVELLRQGRKILLKVGDQLLEGDQVITSEKSFARIELSKGTQMFLGPESQGRIEVLTNQGPNVFGLLNGQVRSLINKEKTEEIKAVVHTPTAALGVRGTELLVNYNAANKVSSMVTISGEVSALKVNFESRACNADCSSKLLRFFSSPQSVAVKAGEVTQVFAKSKMPTASVNISRKQLAAIIVNGPFENATKEVPPPNPIDSQRKNDMRPGGFIDFQTALYVEPPKESIFDPKTQTYLSLKKMGNVDFQSGNYQAPEGWKLKENGRFVTVGDGNRADDPNRFLRMRIDAEEGMGDNPNDHKKPPLNQGRIVKFLPPLQGQCQADGPCLHNLPGQDILINGDVLGPKLNIAVVEIRL